jgi:DNA repair exonuclease SbcCD ATPase subunit
MKNIKKKTWENAKYPIVRIPQSLYDDIKPFAEKRNLSIGEVLNWAWYKGIKQYEKVEFPTFQTMREKMEREIKAKMENEIRADYESKIKTLESEVRKAEIMINDAIFSYDELNKENEALKNQLKEQIEINAMLKQRIDDLEKQLKEIEALDVDALRKERDDWKNKAKEWESKIMDERALKNDVIKELNFMKNEVCKELKRIGEFEPSVKLFTDSLINAITKKADYELDRLKD